MKRKWIKILAAAMCIMMAVPMIASADQSDTLNRLDLEKKCSLTVKFPESSDQNKTMVDDLEKNSGSVVYDLYKVAVMVNDGGYYTYKITKEFEELLSDPDLLAKYGGEGKSLVDAKGNLRVPRDENGSDHGMWEDMAQKAALLALDPVKAGARVGENAEDGNSDADNTGTVSGNALPAVGKVMGMEKPGVGAKEFEDVKVRVLTEKPMSVKTPDTASLEAGLYLLIARGKDVENYITHTQLKVKDAEGKEKTEEKLATVAYTDEYVYTFAPQLISLPTKAPDTSGMVSTANSGDWYYSPIVYLKPEQHARYGYLEIVKELLRHESFAGQTGEATFVFQVEAQLNGETVYSDVKTMIFSAAGTDSVVIDNIPVGAIVTVTEVYSGAGYTLTEERGIGQGRYAEGVIPDGGASVNYIYTSTEDIIIGDRGVTGVTIEADSVASVKFTNDYDGRQTNGHGVINRYIYGENGWANDVEQQYTDRDPNQPQDNSPQDNQ